MCWTAIYIGNLTFQDYLNEIRESYPGLYDLLEPTRIEAGAIDRYIKEMDSVSWEFEDKDVGGRGDSLHSLAGKFRQPAGGHGNPDQVFLSVVWRDAWSCVPDS